MIRLPKVEHVNVRLGVVVIEGGEELPIVEYFNAEGDECEPTEALSCVAGTDDFGFMEIDLGPPPTLH